MKMHFLKSLIFLTFFFTLSLSVNGLTANTNKNRPKKTLPITGSWINLAYKDVRNKYTNPQHYDNTDPKLWECKVKELSEMGIEYLIFMEVANMGKAYYPSKIMPWIYDKNRKSPVDAILDEAAKHNIKIFLSTGWAKDQDDDLRNPQIKKRQLQIMEELADLYKDHNAFFGWYLPVEDCLCPILSDQAVVSVNALTEHAQTLTPDKKTLISPYGIGLSEFDNPDYEKQLARLKVDIIAYQDEVGCLRDQFTIPRLKKNWERIRDIHNRLNIELWANCETFTWEDATNDRNSALIPASYARLLSQQVAASNASVDRIISFMFQGIIENPKSTYQLGQPIWSGKVYQDYMSWKNGDRFWELSEASLKERLRNSATPEMLQGNEDAKILLDNMIAEENSNDRNWSRFENGYHEVVLDLNEQTYIEEIFIRMLNYDIEYIRMPLKVYLYISEDGETYRLKSIKDAPNFPNSKHDAWIDCILFSPVPEKVRYVKLAFYASDQVFIDELFINPQII